MTSSRLQEPSHNLPSHLTSFVGRERERADLAALLEAERLVTLIGAPGVGKTRLGLQIAALLLDRFPDGVWLIELAPLVDPALVPRAVADVLGVGEQPDRDLTATLAGYLRTRRLLLVLDNSEHLIGAAAALAETLLQACPGLHILATSREPLAAEGEVTRRVPSLSVYGVQHQQSPSSDSQSSTTVSALAESEAVQLFVERARAVSPSFTLTDRTAPLVGQICSRLDGIPLAVELAAARVRALSVEQIAARLGDRLRLLTGGRRTALPRHQTLRGAVDWSYNLLSEPEQTMLRRLAVFAGGFDLDAVDGVAGDDPRSGPDQPNLSQLDTLVSLVDKSLVQVDVSADGDIRYRLLETFREYGLQKLAEHGKLAEVRDRHRDYWLRVVEDAQPRVKGAGQLETLRRLDREHDNLRAALSWCLEAAAHQPGEQETEGATPSAREVGLRLAGGLWRFWWLRGHFPEGRRWLDRVLAIPSRSDSMTAERSGLALAYLGAARLTAAHGEVHAAIPHLEIALSLSRDAGDDRSVSEALHSLGLIRLYLGEHDLAQRLCEESVEIARRTGDPYTLAMALDGSAQVARFLDEDDRTAAFCKEGLELLRGLGDGVSSAHLLLSQSQALRGLGDRARARAVAEEALRLSRELGDRRSVGLSLHMLGQLALLGGDFVRAVTTLRSAILALHECGEGALIIWSCFRLADGRTQQGVQAMRDLGGGQPLSASAAEYFQQAARLFSAIHARRRQLGMGPAPQMDREYDRALPILRQHLGESAFSQAWTEGQAMTFEQTVEYALEITRDAAPASPTATGETPAARPDPELARLTPREREIATLVARGLANREIAEQLVLTRRTVETHVHNILGKLELTTRGQLAFWAVEHGLLNHTA